MGYRGGPPRGAAVVAHVAVLEKLAALAEHPAVVWVIGVAKLRLAWTAERRQREYMAIGAQRFVFEILVLN